MRVNGGGVLWFACLISIYSPPRYLSRKSFFMDSRKSPSLFIAVRKTIPFMDSKYYFNCPLRCPKTIQHWHKLHPCAYCSQKSLACPTIYLVLVKKLPLLWTQKSSLYVLVLFAKVTLFMESKNSFYIAQKPCNWCLLRACAYCSIKSFLTLLMMSVNCPFYGLRKLGKGKVQANIARCVI